MPVAWSPSAIQSVSMGSVASSGSVVGISILPAGVATLEAFGAPSIYDRSGFVSAATSFFLDTVTMTLTGSAPNQYYVKDHFARIRVALPGTSTSFTVEAVAIGSGDRDLVGIWSTTDPTGLSGWSFNQSVTFTSYGAKQQLTIALPVGTRLIDVTEYAYVTGISAPAFSIPPAVAPLSRCLVYGDSIADGYIATPRFLGYAQQLRYSGRFDSVFQFASAGTSIYSDTSNGTQVTSIVNQLSARLAGATTERLLYIQKGTNDFGLDFWTAANFQTWYANLCDGALAADPLITIAAGKLFHRADEATAQPIHGSTWAQFNAVQSAVATGRPRVRVVDSTAAWTIAQVSGGNGDGLHPFNSTHSLAAAWAASVL